MSNGMSPIQPIDSFCDSATGKSSFHCSNPRKTFVTDKYSFVKGFVFAAFMTLCVFETAGLCASISTKPKRIDGYCSMNITGICKDTGCASLPSEGPKAYSCQRIARQEKNGSITYACECLTEKL